MFAIAFDLTIGELKKYYGEPYNNAYVEIRLLLREYNFNLTQGSVYITYDDSLVSLYQAINALTKVEWFKKSVRDVRVFRVESWSDFTKTVKEGL